ncbi:hypothetical protein Tco_1505069 [Tanacetum coccineum]
MAMDIEENSEFETEEPPFEKITFNTVYKIKTFLKEPPLDLELNPLPDHLEYVFLEEPTFLPVIISSQLSKQNKNKLISVLKRHKQAFSWKTTDIPGICLCMLAIFHDMIEESVEVFMDDFSVFGNSFDNCLNNLDKMLQRCKDANLVLNWRSLSKKYVFSRIDEDTGDYLVDDNTVILDKDFDNNNIIEEDDEYDLDDFINDEDATNDATDDEHKMDLLSFIRTADPTKMSLGAEVRMHVEYNIKEKRRLKSIFNKQVELLKVSASFKESTVQCLLAKAVQNAEVRGEAMPTLPFVTSSVSTTPEYKGGDHTESLARANLRTIGSPTSVPIMTSVTTTTPTDDLVVISKEKLVGSSVFGADSSSAGGSHPIPGGFSDSTGSDFLIGGIRTVIDPDSNLQKAYVPKWNVTNRYCLDDGGLCREMQMSLGAEVRMRAEYNIKEKRRLKYVEAEATEAIRLRVEASKFEVVEKSLRDEAQVLKEHNTTLEKEKCELEVKVADLAASVKVREQDVDDLDDVVTSVKSQNDSLVDQVHGLKTSSAGLQEKVMVYESCIDQLEKFQDDKMKEVNEKFDKLYTDFVEMALHLEEKFYPRLLTTISEPAIGKAVEKGMQDGLSARITHGTEGRNLTDVAAYNPSAEADYISALQRLQSVNFSLIAELRSNKDASVETIMNLLCLEDTLAEKLGLTELQPHVDQLMVPIHHSLDQHVIGASALSLSLDISSTEGTSDVMPATADTTTALSVTFTSVSTVTPISIDDYEVTGVDDHATANDSAADGNVDPFSNVDDVDLSVL